MKKKNMKLKKLGSIKRKDRELSIWYIGRATGMNMISG